MKENIIRRDFVTVGERQVHFRHAGEGPPVVLLHQSPRCSAELEPMIRHLAENFAVIAPDTPGYGQSDPLAPSDAEPSIDQYADALAGFFDSLGLRRPAVFGSHTGAIIATRFASRYPERVCCLVANGILLTSAEERADLVDNYFPRLVPDWHGGHLAWMWARLRDQLVFYPWYRRHPSHRIEWPMALEEIEAGAIDLLESGDNYRGAYRAVLDYDIALDLPRLKTPTCLMVAQTDALSQYVPHYPQPSDLLSIKVVPGFADIPVAVTDYLRQHASAAPAPKLDCDGKAYGITSSMARVHGHQLHLRKNLKGSGKPMLFLHDLGSSARDLDLVLGSLCGARPVLALDLPGHGQSDAANVSTPQEAALLIRDLIAQFDLGSVDVLAEGASAAAALALDQCAQGKIATLLLCNPFAVSSAAAGDIARFLPPDIEPDISGAHLFRAWSYLKDRDLYCPWNDRGAATATPQVQVRSATMLQRKLIDLLKSRSVFAAQFTAAMRATSWEGIAASRARIITTSGHPANSKLVGALVLGEGRIGWNGSLMQLTS